MCKEQRVQSVNGDPPSIGHIALLEDTRQDCKTGPVEINGELWCGNGVDQRIVR